MGFREFIDNFRFRRRLLREFERFQNIRPRKNPSRRYIDKLVRRLQDDETALNARRELSQMDAVIVPSLISALEDPAFKRVGWKELKRTSAPMKEVLELLVPLAPDDAARIAAHWAKSPEGEIRRAVALHLASSGRAAAIPFLRDLMQDPEDDVRSGICFGVQYAVTGKRVEEAFRQEVYDLLLPQCDHEWNDSSSSAPKAMVALDPARASVDLADARLLNLENRNCHEILRACNEAKIPLPESILRDLLTAALPKVVGDRCYPMDYVASEAIGALALRRADGVADIAKSLLDHGNGKIQEAVAEALVLLSGVSDPTGFVLERIKQVGFDGLTHPQQVVYCAFFFDAEVCNGGLMQFFGNSIGDLTPETLAALEELGHKEAHNALSGAIKLIGPLALESNPDLRLTGVEGRWDELQPAFKPLETAFYANSAKLRQAWLLYAIRHAEHFRPVSQPPASGA